MASLKVTFETGVVETYKITPAIEVEFEAYAKMGINKCFREQEKQTDIYYLVWIAIKNSGQQIEYRIILDSNYYAMQHLHLQTRYY